MTTIAYRSGVLAFDSRAINGGGYILSDAFRKFGVLPNGNVWAGAGEVGKITAYMKALEQGKDLPDLGWQSTIVIMTPIGEVRHIGSEGGVTPLDPELFYAFGSGAQAALAAMHMGASAKEAVKIAKKIDHHTGGRIRTVKAVDLVAPAARAILDQERGDG